jgi:ABC-type multidrug transport system ATPase subunit
MASKPTEIEKQNLEAHVELCAVRYGNLETKLNNLEERMDKLELHLIDIKNSLTDKISGGDKQTISIFTTLMGVVLAGLIGFITHGIFK